MSEKAAAVESEKLTLGNSPGQEVLVTPAEPYAVVDASNAAWGAADEIESSDLQVSKIFHQQALSKFVQKGLAQPGDFCDSLTGEVLAKKDAGLEIIVFKFYKKLLISKAIARTGKFKFVESQDVTPENCNLPWEEEVDDGVIKRQMQYNYLCLLPNKLQELPYVLSFLSTKVKSAKKLNTMIAKLKRLGKPSAAHIFKLTSVKETGEKGSWFGVDVTQGSQASAEQMAIAYEWYKQLANKNVIVDETEGETSASYSGGESSGGEEIPF